MESFKKYVGPKNLELRNKIVMAPMCTYESDSSGAVKSFHRTHYGSRAIGGVGLIILEATAVEPMGRISDNDLGIWSNSHLAGLKSIVDEVHYYGGKIGIQLGHAGRKSKAQSDYIVGPSMIPFSQGERVPKDLTKDGIESIIKKFVNGAIRADKAGFDILEIHAAHGYLLHEFLSPVSNERRDAYGGSRANRVRLLKEVLMEIKKVWPSDKALIVRISADDYVEDGIDIKEMVKIVDIIKPFVDMVHVSSGGLIPVKISTYPGYQLDYSEKIRKECDLPTIGVGMINSIEEVEEALVASKADLIALGRLLLRKPYFVMNEAYNNKISYKYPRPYERGFRNI